MKLMGLSSSDWRSSWMKRGIIGYMPVLFAVSILGLVKSVVPASFFLSFVFLIAFGLATLSFSFLVVSISQVSTSAVLKAIEGWFLMFLPWIILFLAASGCQNISRSAQGAICLLAPSCSMSLSQPLSFSSALISRILKAPSICSGYRRRNIRDCGVHIVGRHMEQCSRIRCECGAFVHRCTTRAMFLLHGHRWAEISPC